MNWKWRNQYWNKVDEEIKGVDSRDKERRSDQLFLERMMSIAVSVGDFIIIVYML